MSVPNFVRLKGYVYFEGKKIKLDKDIRVSSFDLFVGNGKTLLKDASINITYGKKYAIIGRNGIGKTQLLKTIYNKEGAFSKIPQWYSIMHLEQEIIGDERTPLEIVLSSDPERLWLLNRVKEMENLQENDEEENLEEDEEEYSLKDLYDRLREIDAFTAEGRALSILKGLQFSDEDLLKSSKNFSGGWRMRIALAKILFVTPDLAILDEPTNHLDLHATLWLEKYLSNYKKTLLIVSHDETILNECVDCIIHFFDFKLKLYNGNYYQYLKIKEQNNRTENNKKRKEKLKIKQPKFVDEKTADFIFPEVNHFQETAVIKFDNVSYSYDGANNVVENLTFGIYMDTHIALIGLNGSGKSTIMKLMNGELNSSSGEINKNPSLKIVKYSQHAEESLNLEMNCIEYMRSIKDLPEKECLKVLGSFGLSGKYANNKILTLSGGQKVRLVFASLTIQNPHLILLDEPTNHLDIDSIKSLEKGLRNYKGGLVIISHNQSILTNCCNVIWTVDNKTVKPFDGTFEDYKSSLEI